ncbi:hypothetical protein NFI96_008452 [Prochilodus magdalenae]|nr:hypothetical protein NFI96_008452 [Prochilodus magdalenae]
MLARHGFCFSDLGEKQKQSAFMFLLNLGVAAAESDTATGETFTELLTSVCSYTTFPFDEDRVKFDHNPQWNFVLDFCSFLKNYETQSGRSVLSALLPVYQSAPAFSDIDLSERKSSLFLEVLKLQTVKKPVELMNWPYEESEVRSFLQCLPYISQLRFNHYDDDELKIDVLEFLQDVFSKAAECDPATKQSFTELLISMCSERAFPFDEKNSQTENVYGASPHLHMVRCDFLLDLYSHVKNYEAQTGRSVLPALQTVYQSAPAVWIIDLSERKSSILLEVLKLQTGKKPVELRGWSDEESEVRSFLQCLPYISQLRFCFSDLGENQKQSAFKFLLNLGVAAAESDTATGESFTELLTSVCSYTTFPFDEDRVKHDPNPQWNFVLDFCSFLKNYETQSGRSVLSALLPVYQSAPAFCDLNLSERKSSLFLEVLKLQPEKKPVELWDWPYEESEVRSFLQCLPYISQLRTKLLQSRAVTAWMLLFLLPDGSSEKSPCEG